MQTQRIVELVGLSAANIRFRSHSKPLELAEGKFWGTCLDTGSGYVIEYYNASDEKQTLMTVLHELAHVVQFQSGRKLDCDEAELWASDFLEYVLDGLN